MATLRGIAPALLLLVLAPVIAEFLLGDFTVRSLGLLPFFIPQYGGGALLIREVTRRSGRGWPTMLMLALAYALIEEGFTTQSLFNPNYVGQRLLDYGYVPALGTSPDWTVFVLSIHVVWSISTPILIAESLAGPRRTTPWLGRFGIAVVAVLFVLGCIATTFGSMQMSPFVAPLPQLLGVAALVALAVAGAFLAFRPGPSPVTGTAPEPWLVGLVALVLAVLFEVIQHQAQARGVPAALSVVAMLACEAVAIALIASWSRGRGWSRRHTLAIATATVLTYSGFGLSTFLSGRTDLGARTDAFDIAGQVVEALVILGLVAWGLRVSRKAIRVA